MAPRFTDMQVLEAMEAIVTQWGHTTVSCPINEPDNFTGVNYTYWDDAANMPGDLFGFTLYLLGVDQQTLIDADNTEDPGIYSCEKFNGLFTEETRMALDAAQHEHDMGSTWGEVLHVFSTVLATKAHPYLR